MTNNLTNLLPPTRQRLLTREYHLRLGVVVVALATLLVGVAAVLLLPTYVFLTGSAQEKETRLAHIKSTLSSADELALSSRLTALSNDAAALIALSKRPSASAALRGTLAIPRPGVTLSGLSYTPGAASSVVVLTGAASTRDALRGYQLALQNIPTVVSVTLPVSVYAKDSDITFSITITLKP